MIKAIFSKFQITSTSNDAFALYEKSNYGEKKENKIEYMPIEALYLISNKKMNIFESSKELSFDSFLKKAKKQDPKIELKLKAFSDLRKKGYVLKSALKFGADFRIYEKGVKPGKDHAKWLLYIIKETDKISWQEYASKNRIAHSTRKKLLIAVIDQEGDISYYENSWIRV